MSVAVDLDALDAQIERFGSRALLVTTSTDGPPHISSVRVSVEGRDLVMRIGRKTRANAAERPAVSLVWTAPTEHEFCLIVDGTARVQADDDLTLTPTAAILHRLAAAPAG